MASAATRFARPWMPAKAGGGGRERQLRIFVPSTCTVGTSQLEPEGRRILSHRLTQVLP